MLFNSWVFAGFMAIVLPLYFLLPFRLQNILLLAASYVFYGAWDWRFLLLLILSTILDYSLGLAIDASENPRRRKIFLALSIGTSLSVLGFFKYWNFFIESAGALLARFGLDASVPTLNVILPVGLSFYTFQTMGYAIDVYRRNQRACRSLLDYALYVAYFPQLVAGPIERITNLLPQIQRPRKTTWDMFTSGSQLMFWGFVKKIVIADGLAPYVDLIYSNPGSYDGVHLWLGAYAFAIQVYADFSGYTDIARGVSRILGIELMLNFRQPYFSRSIPEFWQRWHLSLSTWMRDYLYVPLGGSRRGEFKAYRNLLITTMASGFWHGAAWTFVIWGAIHGITLSIYRAIEKWTGHAPDTKPPRTVRTWIICIICGVATFHFLAATHVWFRAPDVASALEFWRGFVSLPYQVDTQALWRSGIVPSFVFYTALFLLIDFPCWYGERETVFTAKHPWFVRSLGYAVALFILCFVREGETGAYIYFQF